MALNALLFRKPEEEGLHGMKKRVSATTIRLSEAERKQLEASAKALGLGITQVIRMAIKNFFEKELS